MGCRQSKTICRQRNSHTHSAVLRQHSDCQNQSTRAEYKLDVTPVRGDTVILRYSEGSPHHQRHGDPSEYLRMTKRFATNMSHTRKGRDVYPLDSAADGSSDHRATWPPWPGASRRRVWGLSRSAARCHGKLPAPFRAASSFPPPSLHVRVGRPDWWPPAGRS